MKDVEKSSGSEAKGVIGERDGRAEALHAQVETNGRTKGKVVGGLKGESGDVALPGVGQELEADGGAEGVPDDGDSAG